MASKSKSRRRVFRASCILAALIVAGSSFAWFTSKDEVTNRLSASADYGVAIAESYQPPENWVPGQEVNKDAAATNTGNVDAFVRMYLTGKMRLLTQSKTAANPNADWDGTNSFGTIVSALEDVKDTDLVHANLTKMDTNGNYFKTLDKTQTKNPNASIETNNDGYAQNEALDNTKTGAYSEVQAMQGGILAYAPSGAKYSYVLDEETELPVYLTSQINGAAATTDYRKVQVPAGTLVIVGDSNPKAATLDATNKTLVPDSTSVTVTSPSGATHDYTSTVYIASQTHDDGASTFFVPQNVEYESFTPMTDGLYLFLRNEKDQNQDDPEFSGYYVDGISTTGKTPADGTYYALNTGIVGGTPADAPTYRSDYTVKGATGGTGDENSYIAPVKIVYDEGDKNLIGVAPTTNLELFTAQYSDVGSGDLKWYYDSTNKRYIVLADKGTAGTFDEATDVAVIINLAKDNIGAAAQQWTEINAPTSGTSVVGMKENGSGDAIAALPVVDPSNIKFYYNDDLESGDTTVKLVDKVKLYEGVTEDAYLGFDFDLNVHLDSVQVTFDENGVEQDTAVAKNKGETWKDTTATGGATGAGTVATGEKEISKVTWTATT